MVLASSRARCGCTLRGAFSPDAGVRLHASGLRNHRTIYFQAQLSGPFSKGKKAPVKSIQIIRVPQISRTQTRIIATHTHSERAAVHRHSQKCIGSLTLIPSELQRITRFESGIHASPLQRSVRVDVAAPRRQTAGSHPFQASWIESRDSSPAFTQAHGNEA